MELEKNKHFKGNEHSKHANKGKLNKKRIILTVLFIIIIVIIIYIIVSNQLFNIKKPIQQNEIDLISNTSLNEIEQNTIEVVDVDIPETQSYDGYTFNVMGLFVADKVELSRNILTGYSNNDEFYKALRASIVMYDRFGKENVPDVNEPGNFVISGHNTGPGYYGKSDTGMLKRFRDEMEKNDTFYMINRKNKTKVTYQIYDKYISDPYDLSCLEQNAGNKREVTIITCTDGGLTRVIFKAREI